MCELISTVSLTRWMCQPMLAFLAGSEAQDLVPLDPSPLTVAHKGTKDSGTHALRVAAEAALALEEAFLLVSLVALGLEDDGLALEVDAVDVAHAALLPRLASLRASRSAWMTSFGRFFEPFGRPRRFSPSWRWGFSFFGGAGGSNGLPLAGA